jgi:hypothetical protein
MDKFKSKQAAMIAEANAPAGADIKQIITKSEGSLRRIQIELSKL